MTRRTCTLALLAVAMTSPAYADRFWATNGDGTFSDGANWSATDGGAGGAGAPTLTENTFYQLAGAAPYTVSFTATGESRMVTVTNNRVTFDTNAFEYQIGSNVVTNQHVTVRSSGAGGTGLLKLSDGTIRLANIPTTANGTTVSNFTYVSGGTGSDGAKLWIDGPTSTYWGGQLGVGSQSPFVPTDSDPAKSRLEITNGGKGNFISGGTVGASGNGQGSIRIDGSGSQLSIYSLSVGGNATSTLDISNGGLLTIRSPGTALGFAGFTNFSLGTVTLDGGTIEVPGNTVSSFVRNRNEFRGVGTIRDFNQTNTQSNFENIADLANNQKGKLRPGDLSAAPAIGQLTLEDTVFRNQTDGTLRAEVYFDIAGPSSFDRILVKDVNAASPAVSAVLGGTIILQNLGTPDFPSATFMDLIIAPDILDQGYTHNLASVAPTWNAGSGGVNATIGIVTIANGDYPANEFAGQKALRVSVTPVPEPASLALLASGAVMVAARRRRG